MPATPVERVRAWCHERGYHVDPFDRVTEATAAAMLDLAPGYLRNMRCNGRELPFQKTSRGRVLYALADLAAYLEAPPPVD